MGIAIKPDYKSIVDYWIGIARVLAAHPGEGEDAQKAAAGIFQIIADSNDLPYQDRYEYIKEQLESKLTVIDGFIYDRTSFAYCQYVDRLRDAYNIETGNPERSSWYETERFMLFGDLK